MDNKQFMLSNEQKLYVKTAVKLLSAIPDTDTTRDNVISVNMTRAVGFINNTVFPVLSTDGETEFLDVPSSLVETVVIPFTKEASNPILTGDEDPVTNISENGGSVSYAILKPVEDISFDDYKSFVNNYKRLRTCN